MRQAAQTVRPLYGSAEWLDQEYGRVSDDPWGLSWRPSQFFRYREVLSIIDTVPEPIHRVMDIGCATGEFTHVLARHARRDTTVVGVDCVTAAIDRARRKFPHLTFRKESVLALGRLYPAHFDLITCLEVLYYLEKDAQQEAIRSACRTLRPGGYAVFSSFLSSPPHFSPARLGDLLSQEFQIVAVHLVYLRLVTAFEKVAMKVDGFIAPARRRLPRTRIPTVGWIAMRGVIAAEAVSRLLGPLAASHAIILTRRPI